MSKMTNEGKEAYQISREKQHVDIQNVSKRYRVNMRKISLNSQEMPNKDRKHLTGSDTRKQFMKTEHQLPISLQQLMVLLKLIKNIHILQIKSWLF